ncbi:unnamed protein product [Schistocephalus solidus]|uniref:G_PROTEIN_RECEP_F1_2 domain-containing protein n=1 Tax=Schistocephalus solidus TaxID=70667 RepID=A0A183SUV0_SCHSO|nr:unnamed protein product [Schistocephalus solidus]
MNNVESKTFWHCVPSSNFPTIVDIGFYIFETTGMFLNAFVLAGLSKVHPIPRTSLMLLRSITVCCLLTAFVNFLEHVYPYSWRSHNYHFDRLICIFWKSRFFYWIFFALGTHYLVFFSLDRLAVIEEVKSYKSMLEEQRILAFHTTAVVSGILFTTPQVLTVNLQGDTCDCAPTQVNIPFLSVIYAHVYVWFTLMFVFVSSLLAFVSWKLVKAIRKPSGHDRIDNLSLLTLESQACVKGTHSAPPLGWRSASMCILPLALSYFLTLVYDSTYQFLSALNLTTFIINSIQQQIGALLLVVNTSLIPSIFISYIPALRSFLVGVLHRLHLHRQKR